MSLDKSVSPSQSLWGNCLNISLLFGCEVYPLLLPVCLHSQYQTFVFNWLFRFIASRNSLYVSELQLVALFLSLDLVAVYSLVQHTYHPVAGRRAWDPCDLFRSLLLMTTLGYESPDHWVSMLRRNPLYAVLSGFSPGNVPGASTLRDFCDRLWDYDQRQERRKRRKRLRRHRRKPTKKLKKGRKLQLRHPGIVQKIADRLIHGAPAGSHPEDILNQILKRCFVLPSGQLHLLGDPHQLIVSGDGSLYESGANPLGRKVCNCRQQGVYNCDCPRRFPDPDASWGWDSYRERYVYGYTAYELVAAGGAHDLPCYLLFADCQRHDSVSGLVALDKFYQLYPEFHVQHFLADSAHDALPIYQYLQHHHTLPVIDLNPRCAGKSRLIGDITIDELGRPVCPEKLIMRFDGACPGRNRFKWVCPLADRGKHTPECACSNSAYGRTFYTKPEDDPRLHTLPPRGSAEWKDLLAKRSASERSNSRKKIDLKLMHTRIRCKHRRCIQIALAAMVQHIRAWLAEALKGFGPVAFMLQSLMRRLPVAA